jgi:ubiquinone/menaquinone biosynthesis C-methylase UbiE
VQPNQQQSDAWNGSESVHYVDQADRYDRQLAPITDALLARADISADDAALDVGCGCGAMTLKAAERARRVVGVDISGPLIEVATDRARRNGVVNVEFVVADAQTHEFDERFDVVTSQFGLMFFDDPVAAFERLRQALAPDGRLVFATWQRLDSNEWLAPVVHAVRRHADVPEFGGLAGGGGMFALRDDDEILSLLQSAGFDEVEIEPLRPTLTVGGGGDVAESAEFLLGMGIVRGLIGRLDQHHRELAIASVRDELAACHEDGIGVRLGSCVWMVSAAAQR